MSDIKLRQAVLDELEWDPRVNAAHIGVTAEGSVITLSGFVSTYAEKLAAERAAKRVAGVRGIAQEIEVRLPSDSKTADDQIAKRAIDVLSWCTMIPPSRVNVLVQDNWVTLSGKVDWAYQRDEAEKAVRKLSGIRGISNFVEVDPRIEAANVKQRIENAFKRNADLEADSIRVTASGGKVTLEGKVKAWYERELAERTAWSAPGVTAVDDRIAVGQ